MDTGSLLLISLQICTYTFLWFSLFLLTSRLPRYITNNRKNEVEMRIELISLIHGLVTFLYACHFVSKHGFILRNTPDCYALQIICLSLGYFFHSLALLVWLNLLTVNIFSHHVICIVIFLFYIFDGNDSLAAGMVGLFVGQASNSPMHVRGLFRKSGNKHAVLCLVAEIAYIFTYIVFRTIISFGVFVNSILDSQTPKFVSVSIFMVVFQSVFYFPKMTGILRTRW